jgi:hypothetical protein
LPLLSSDQTRGKENERERRLFCLLDGRSSSDPGWKGKEGVGVAVVAAVFGGGARHAQTADYTPSFGGFEGTKTEKNTENKERKVTKLS